MQKYMYVIFTMQNYGESREWAKNNNSFFKCIYNYAINRLVFLDNLQHLSKLAITKVMLFTKSINRSIKPKVNRWMKADVTESISWWKRVFADIDLMVGLTYIDCNIFLSVKVETQGLALIGQYKSSILAFEIFELYFDHQNWSSQSKTDEKT